MNARGAARATVSLALLVLLGADAAPTRAATLGAAGWWQRAAIGAAAARPAPPAGGVAVASAPGGPSAVAAVRFELGQGEIEPVVTLDVVSSGGAASPSIVACPAVTRWSPAAGGQWDRRPEADCSRAIVAGQPSADAKRWRFPATTLVRSGVVDIVLLPAPLASVPGAGTVWPSFDVDFDAPTAGSLSVERVPSASAGTRAPALEPEATPDPLALAAPLPNSTAAAKRRAPTRSSRDPARQLAASERRRAAGGGDRSLLPTLAFTAVAAAWVVMTRHDGVIGELDGSAGVTGGLGRFRKKRHRLAARV